ncbi:MAG: T9SS type A sorting domain-containing protein [Bacteroidales bacterium]|nr:T9SS type A sorting domain-containing protein [Bacteroidales bacterium]
MKKFYLFLMLLFGATALMAQGTDSLNVYTVEVDPYITHGSVNVRPIGEVQVGARVMVTAVPDNNYHVVSVTAYRKDHQSQTVAIEDNVFIMPNFNVVVSAVFGGNGPIINGQVVAPAPICDGESLTLTVPEVTNATSQGWFLFKPNSQQDELIEYTNQPLDVSYNHWSLVFWASNAMGYTESAPVTITVNPMPDATMTGENSTCTMMEAEYSVTKDSHCSFTWAVTDKNATVTASNHKVKVLWVTPGAHKVSVVVENTSTGCSVTNELNVNVQSFVTELNNIVAKVHDGKEYILIYPNPADVYKYQWYKDGEKIAGATGQYYYKSGGLDNGEYTVYVSNNSDANGNLFCGAFTAPHTVNNSSRGFDIWPNPAFTNEGLVINNQSQNVAELSIYSLEGKLLHRQHVEPGNSTITVSLAKGIYFCHLSDGVAEPTVQKLVIQ